MSHVAPHLGASEACMVLILGMHRSGTSCLAGCLQQRGLYLGRVVERSPHNPKGNRENPDIMRLNESVLAESGGSWDRPPGVISWNARQVRKRDRIIASYLRHSARFGFKDPRTLITLPFWADCQLNLQCVGTFRHPLATAQSLNKRDGMPIPEGLDLWKRYNSRLESCWVTYRFPVVSFDLARATYLSSIEKIASDLKLAAVSSPTESSFFEHSLRRQSPDHSVSLPPDVMDLYERLNAICGEQQA